jgi:transposase InsO family protein
VKYAAIRDHLGDYPVRLCCRVLRVSAGGYYDWRGRPPGVRQRRRQELVAAIRQAHAASGERYGSPRVARQLRAEGVSVCENTVARVMHSEGLRAKGKRAFVPRTTDSAHAQPVVANVLDRQFQAATPDTKWAGDITYIPTDEGWLYLAGVIDLCSRRIVGWSMADHRETDLVSDALGMAVSRRCPSSGLLHHSDRGVQYASDRYQSLLSAHGMTASMSGRGDCWDNAVMESFWATLKTERVHHERYATRAAARRSIFEYIEVFYNRKRLHRSLGYVSPETFEASLRGQGKP